MYYCIFKKVKFKWLYWARWLRTLQDYQKYRSNNSVSCLAYLIRGPFGLPFGCRKFKCEITRMILRSSGGLRYLSKLYLFDILRNFNNTDQKRKTIVLNGTFVQFYRKHNQFRCVGSQWPFGMGQDNDKRAAEGDDDRNISITKYLKQ